jgi:glycerol-3-phosphate dehydrogenase
MAPDLAATRHLAQGNACRDPRGPAQCKRVSPITVDAMDDPSKLGPDYRAASLRRMESEKFDVLIVGGGVTGCGAALDAASRGLKVALVEQRDFAAGTSSRSSKMFHGGLRYLEQFQFGLVREALRERNLMVETLCPYLATPTRFLYPLTHRLWERAYVGAGVLLYDILARAGGGTLSGHRHHSRTGALQMAPGLNPDVLVGGVSYSDVIVDDARHTMVLARTAASLRACLMTSTRVIEIVENHGRVIGALVQDLESGRVVRIDATAVLNTTGVWTDEIEAMAGQHQLNVRASKGIHIVVPKEAVDLAIGLILRTERSVLFIIPWKEFWIIGTTDTDWELGKAHPAASRTDIAYLLAEVNRVLTVPLGTDDIVGVYAGLRPLLRGESDITSKLSREHSVREVRPGLVSVAGGKYTTYRVMARDAIDAIATMVDREVPRSNTGTIPLVGTGNGPDKAGSGRLHSRYGDRASDLTRLISTEPRLGEPVPGAAPYLLAEVVYGTSHEGALHLDDILTRRTRISIETAHRGTDSARDVARIMAPILNWDGATVEREVGHYLARVEAERDSQSKADDETADAARMGAPDVRMRG